MVKDEDGGFADRCADVQICEAAAAEAEKMGRRRGAGVAVSITRQLIADAV